MDGAGSRCKIVVVGDAQCGKTALLHVFAKDCYPENYVPTVFENYTASFEIDKHRIELNMWDTSASKDTGGIKPVMPHQKPPRPREGAEMFSCLKSENMDSRKQEKEEAKQSVNRGPQSDGEIKATEMKCPVLLLSPAEQKKHSDLLRCDKTCDCNLSVILISSSYYDNVRPLAYPDSDAVLICFDISRPETLDSVIKKWQGETQEFCPNAKVVLVGCKLDMRTDVNTLRELSKQRLIPVTHEQGTTIARQIGAVAYVECTSKVSENSVRDVFHVTTVASVRRPLKPQLKRSSSRRGLKRVSQLPLPPLPGRTEQMDQAPAMRKGRAKSCVLM
ncbi:unnamed protein product, partial [Tetraodon nigroviridis]